MPKSRKRYKVKKKHTKETPENLGIFGGMLPKGDKAREHLKLLLFLVTWVIFLSGIYMFCTHPEIQFAFVMPIYLVLGVILFLVWFIYNGGFKKPDIDKIEKPEETSYEDFCKFIAELKERQRKAKYFLILFIPFPMIMLVDYVIIVWGEKLAG